MEKIETMKVTGKEKFAYGSFGFAANLVFGMVTSFLLFFYTDIVGIPAAIAGTLFLVSRIWDAVNDPLIGSLADRTKTRWGKYRPYLLFSALPIAIFGVLVFTKTSLGSTGAIVYAFITYNLLMIAYTCADVPGGALIAVMTQDNNERASLSGMRFVGAMIGTTIVVGATLPLVGVLGNGDQARGFQLTMAIFCILAIILWVLMFAFVKERVSPAIEEKHSFGKSMGSVVKNGPWWIMICIGILVGAGIFTRIGVTMFYCTYNMGNQNLATPFLLSSTMSMLIGSILSGTISRKTSRKSTFYLSLGGGAVAFMVFFFLSPANFTALLILNIIGMTFFAISLPLAFSMVGEVVDYGEWKTGIRAAGITSSGMTFGNKVGSALAGAAAGWGLSLFGYNPGMEQTSQSLFGINFMMSAIPVVTIGIAFLLVRIYPINEELFNTIINDLKRRKNNE